MPVSVKSYHPGPCLDSLATQAGDAAEQAAKEADAEASGEFQLSRTLASESDDGILSLRRR